MILIDDYPIDAALHEVHHYEADVTSYNVESGSRRTDNVLPKPLEVEITGVVSESPLAQVLAARRARSLADPAFMDSPVSEAFDRMVALMTDRSRGGVTIETSLKVYTNMILISFVPEVDKETGRALRFTAGFQQITMVTNARTRVRVASPAVPNVKSKTSGPAVVVINRPAVPEDWNITTLSGAKAHWNEERGRYEYDGDDTSLNTGDPVPARDLGDYTKYDNKTSPIPEGGLPLDPSELGPDGKPVNSLYYDYQDDAWKNTDGTPVTRQQLDSELADRKRRGDGFTTPAEPEEEHDTPWWQPKNGLGNIGHLTGRD